MLMICYAMSRYLVFASSRYMQIGGGSSLEKARKGRKTEVVNYLACRQVLSLILTHYDS